MDEFLLRALAAGVAIALVGGALGSFLVWRRMAFFGDTLAHGALLGIALGLFLDIDLTLGALLLCLLVAFGFARLQGSRHLASDTLLAVIAHGTLAFGIIAVAMLSPRRASLESYLFGDLLAVANADIVVIGTVGAGAALVAAVCWRAWLSMAVDEELARIEGVDIERMRLLQMLAFGALIGVGMQVIGALLVTALMIVPPAAARACARSPEQMALGGALFGCVAVAAGIGSSYAFDTPAGPSVAAAACLLFVLAHALARRR
ncbi:MAG: High-affinity zinc uptake system membrane protein ZnuB [Pseudomonadales bacterium]|nr:High-affinity zinc uptake system membrane protein ZnuB [Pseudomonadales bacterium]